MLFGYLAGSSKSRRLPLLLGLLALGAATALLAVGTSISFLISGRILQGLSAAIVWTVGVSLLVDTVKQDQLGQAMGYVSMAMTAGDLVGPPLAGIVYNNAGYGSVFAMCFVLIGVDIFLRLVMIEKKDARQWTAKCESQTNRPSRRCSIHASEEDRLLASETNRPSSAPTSEPEASIASKLLPAQRLPPSIWLLTSPRILVCLLGSLVHSSLLTTLDSVCPHVSPLSYHSEF